LDKAMQLPSLKTGLLFNFAEEVGDLDDVSYNPFEGEVALNQVGYVML
jgi:hypothetical protein